MAIAHANRQNLSRAVREIARAGIDQFIDVGNGLPTADNEHTRVIQADVRDPRSIPDTTGEQGMVRSTPHELTVGEQLIVAGLARKP